MYWLWIHIELQQYMPRKRIPRTIHCTVGMTRSSFIVHNPKKRFIYSEQKKYFQSFQDAFSLTLLAQTHSASMREMFYCEFILSNSVDGLQYYQMALSSSIRMPSLLNPMTNVTVRIHMHSSVARTGAR